MSERRDALTWLLRALGITFAVLAVTGIYEAFRYLPTAADDGWWNESAQFLHRWSAYAFVGVLLATAVAFATRGRDRSRAMAVWGGLAVAAVGAAAAIVTGPDLRWDQLALWAVTVGTDIKGVFRLSSVKFVLLGTEEIGLDDYRRTVWLHVLGFPVVALAGIGVLWCGVRRRAADIAERDDVEVPA